MTDVEPDALVRLEEAAGLWVVAPATGASAVVGAACQALVDGSDSPALRELAGAPTGESAFVLSDLVAATLEDLDLVVPDGERAVVLAARHMSRRMLAGDLAPRDLARWAHLTIGHEGPRSLQPLVELDDAYDEADVIGRTVDDVTADAHDVVQQLLDDPLP
ncbi:hypothetical protein GCM10027446_26030 [Angustibacter peucedani]